MLVVAVDPATNTGICEGLVGKTPTLLAWKLRKSPEEEHEDLFGRATKLWVHFLSSRVPYAVAVEAPVRANGETNDKTIAFAAGLYAVFTGVAKAKGIKVLRARVNTWRAYSLQDGNINGKQAKLRCVDLCRQLRWPAPTHDAAEAAGIWLWACGQVSSPLFGRVA